MITSVQNPKIKRLVKLRDRKNRVSQEIFSVEGEREISRALLSGYQIFELYVCDDYCSLSATTVIEGVSPDSLFYLSKDAFAKAAVRSNSDGLIAVFHSKSLELEDLNLNGKNLLILENIEKPGNLGALLRTADGAGIGAVISVDSPLDLYNPNVIRSSLGAAFSVPFVSSGLERVVAFLRDNNYRIVAASPNADVPYFKSDLREGAAILLGSEAEGVSSEALSFADQKVTIPMLGVADSLNVSVAGAVLIYESLRQSSI